MPKTPSQDDRKRKLTAKPEERPNGPRVEPDDPVEEASYESFPASDPPAFMSPARPGEPRPPGKRRTH